MKTTLLLKRIDIWLQGLALLIPLAGIALKPYYFFFAYFTVGGVQVLSCIANRVLLQKQFRASSRSGYEATLAITAVFGAIADLADHPGGKGTMVYLLFLMLGGVVMAIWYFIMSSLEIDNIKMDLPITPEINEDYYYEP